MSLADAAARFWARVERRGNDDCWLWHGAKGGQCGHGQLWVGGQRVVASRFSWELHNGPIPEGLWVLHRCDVGSCVNPAHLFLGTPKDNTQDMLKKGRQGNPMPKRLVVGEQNGRSRLREWQVREIRRRYVKGVVTLEDLGAEYGVSPYAVHDVIRGRTWRHLVPVEEGVGRGDC